MPPNTVYVGRTSRWGNPFVIGKFQNLGLWIAINGTMTQDQLDSWHDHDGTILVDLSAVIGCYRKYAEWMITTKRGDEWIAPLRGKDLVCWCPLDQPCHADVLLEISNADA